LGKAYAALVLEAIVKVEVAAAPLGVTLAGLKRHVAFAGNPLQARLVAALKPLIGVTVTVMVAVLPFVTVPLVGVSEMEKSGAGSALTVQPLRRKWKP